MAKRARRNRSKQRRNKRRRNPRYPWGVIAGSTAVVGLAGYGIYRYVEHRRSRPTYPPLPDKEGGVLGCEIGPAYPGFIQDADGNCVPSGTTPPGIYVDTVCQDFVFVNGDEGPQPTRLSQMITIAAGPSRRSPQSSSVDPAAVALQFLNVTWPDCDWTPDPDGPPRLVHMFQALTILIAREANERGARVLGTYSADDVDALVKARLADLGLPAFKPSIVPEFDLAEPVTGPGGKVFPSSGTGGIDIPDPGPKQGMIDLPGGQGATPGQQGEDPWEPPVGGGGGVVLPLPPCAVEPFLRTKTVGLDPTSWAERKVYETKVFEFAGKWAACQDYDLDVGVCIRVLDDIPYGMVSLALNGLDGFDWGDIRMLNVETIAVDFAQFRSPPTWKKQITCRVRKVNGQIDIGPIADVTGTPEGATLDPCANKIVRWPIPSNGHYNLLDMNNTWQIWKSVPKVTLVASGNAVKLRVEYTGVPIFQVSDSYGDVRAIYAPTEPTLSFRSVAQGNTP